MIGKMVTSKAGHDKGNIYFVINLENDFLFLVDGKYKTKLNPKKKKRKHVQLINIETVVGNKIVSSESYTDEEIKREIKLYKSERNINDGRQ